MTTLEEEVHAQVEVLSARTRADVVTEWDEPLPLSSNEALPLFPADLLPWWVGEYVESLAIATQTPVDLAGMLGLSVLGACAGGRVWISPRAGWKEPLNIWTATGLPSGERKSAVMEGMTRCFWEIEQELLEAAIAEITEQRTLRDIAEGVAADMKRAAVKGEASTAEAIEAAREAEAIIVPPEPRLTVGDITPERLLSMLVEQQGRLALFAAEGGVFGSMLGRYERGKGVSVSLDVWLHAHAGEPIRSDRQGDKRAEGIKSACLTLGLAIQPSILEDLARTPELRDRGAVARFLFALPKSLMGYRDSDAAAVSAEVEKTYQGQLRWLVSEMDRLPTGSVLAVSQEARKELRGFSEMLEPRLRPSGDLLSISDWAGKLAGAVLRIAGLLHLAEYGAPGIATPVAEETMRRAVAIGRYLLAHALAVFDLMGACDETERARHMQRFLKDWLSRKPRQTFTARDVMAVLSRSAWPRIADVESVLDHLVDLGWLRRPTVERSGAAGRPPKTLYEAHPKMATQSTQSTKTHSVDYVGSVGGPMDSSPDPSVDYVDSVVIADGVDGSSIESSPNGNAPGHSEATQSTQSTDRGEEGS